MNGPKQVFYKKKKRGVKIVERNARPGPGTGGRRRPTWRTSVPRVRSGGAAGTPRGPGAHRCDHSIGKGISGRQTRINRRGEK